MQSVAIPTDTRLRPVARPITLTDAAPRRPAPCFPSNPMMRD